MSLEKSLIMDNDESPPGMVKLVKQLSEPNDFNSSINNVHSSVLISRQSSSKSLGRSSTADSSFDSISPEPLRYTSFPFYIMLCSRMWETMGKHTEKGKRNQCYGSPVTAICWSTADIVVERIALAHVYQSECCMRLFIDLFILCS